MPKKPVRRKVTFFQRIKRLILVLALLLIGGSIAAVGLMRFFPVPISAFMIYRHYEDYRAGKEFKRIDYRWVNRSEISPKAFGAVIASEDQRFFSHNGFDVESIMSAIDTWMEGGKLRGASTISQQVAKNLFLTPDKNFFRKGLEAWFTVLIENFWSKERILEVYLNIAEFGDHLFGVEAASRRYFSIPSKRLTAGQAAILAATLPNPHRIKADRPTAYIYKRQAWILGQMRNLGY